MATNYFWPGTYVDTSFADDFNSNSRWALSGGASIGSGVLTLSNAGAHAQAALSDGYVRLFKGAYDGGSAISQAMLVGCSLNGGRGSGGYGRALLLEVKLNGVAYGIALYRIFSSSFPRVQTYRNDGTFQQLSLNSFGQWSGIDIAINLSESNVAFFIQLSGGGWTSLFTLSGAPGHPMQEFQHYRIANETWGSAGGSTGTVIHSVSRADFGNVASSTPPISALVANGAVTAGGTITSTPTQTISSAGGIAPSTALGTPKANLTVFPAGAGPSAGAGVGQPAVRRIGFLIVEGSIVSTPQFGIAKVNLHDQYVSLWASGIGSTVAFGIPYVNNSQDIVPSGISDPAAMGTPIVVRALVPPLILAPRTGVKWKLVIADRNGTNLLDVTNIATDRKFSWRLNRPESASFRLPADDDRMLITHSDGFPLVWPILRFLKAYRQEPVSNTDPTPIYRLRFCGPIWQMQDDGAGEGQSTMVVAFGIMQLLQKRACIDNQGHHFMNPQGGNPPGPRFTARIGDALNALIANSKQWKGGLPIDVIGGWPATPVYVLNFEGKMIYDAFIETSDMLDGLDYEFRVKENCRADLIMSQRRGADRPNAVFTYARAGSNCVRVTRLVDAQTFSNAVVGVGSNSAVGGAAFDSGAYDNPSISVYGTMEHFANHPHIVGQFSASNPASFATLTALAQEELAFRSKMRQIISWVPQAGIAPEPFLDFDVGDTIRAHAGPILRGGFGGVQRVYGIDIDLNEEGVENLGSVLTSPES